jgi:hypothetical protein
MRNTKKKRREENEEKVRECGEWRGREKID